MEKRIKFRLHALGPLYFDTCILSSWYASIFHVTKKMDYCCSMTSGIHTRLPVPQIMLTLHGRSSTQRADGWIAPASDFHVKHLVRPLHIHIILQPALHQVMRSVQGKSLSQNTPLSTYWFFDDSCRSIEGGGKYASCFSANLPSLFLISIPLC